MVSQEDADRCIEEVASSLKRLTYDELVGLGKLHEVDTTTVDGELSVGSETVYVSTTMSTLGWFRKRVCVEMILGDENGQEWPRVPCVYFERSKSGRLYVEQKMSKLGIAMFKALPYAFIGSVVIGLVALVWHLFLRTG